MNSQSLRPFRCKDKRVFNKISIQISECNKPNLPRFRRALPGPYDVCGISRHLIERRLTIIKPIKRSPKRSKISPDSLTNSGRLYNWNIIKCVSFFGLIYLHLKCGLQRDRETYRIDHSEWWADERQVDTRWRTINLVL